MRSEEEGRLGEAGGEQEWLSTPHPCSLSRVKQCLAAPFPCSEPPLAQGSQAPAWLWGASYLRSPSSNTHPSHPAPAVISDQRFSTRLFFFPGFQIKRWFYRISWSMAMAWGRGSHFPVLSPHLGFISFVLRQGPLMVLSRRPGSPVQV